MPINEAIPPDVQNASFDPQLRGDGLVSCSVSLTHKEGHFKGRTDRLCKLTISRARSENGSKEGNNGLSL